MPDYIIGEVRKNARESICVILREKRGEIGCDLRIATTNGRGAMVETAKGLRIPLQRLGELIIALQDAQRVASAVDFVCTDATDKLVARQKAD
ncbi:hypothetical protein [Methylobacterium durans]|uniref:Uncharacterized protein n=1 Tax=Methylobacterium durans TaxID=2202825 RepID=A0A2U8WDF6_9HYPH|nr:hypothetical protein [Methylobacterium durans]AWN43480.1 hypothetical protein DK389_26955 [Methylobacterium durans]